MFTIKQKISNETDKKYDFYSCSQIIRNQIPDIIDFLILHEGLIATLDDDWWGRYDDIQEKSLQELLKGWLDWR